MLCGVQQLVAEAAFQEKGSGLISTMQFAVRQTTPIKTLLHSSKDLLKVQGKTEL